MRRANAWTAYFFFLFSSSSLSSALWPHNKKTRHRIPSPNTSNGVPKFLTPASHDRMHAAKAVTATQGKAAARAKPNRLKFW